MLPDVVPENSLHGFANGSLQLPTWFHSLKRKIYDSPALHNTRSFLYAPAPKCKRWQRISWRSRLYRTCSFHAGMMFPILCCRSLEILKSMPTISQAAPSARTVCTCRLMQLARSAGHGDCTTLVPHEAKARTVVVTARYTSPSKISLHQRKSTVNLCL